MNALDPRWEPIDRARWHARRGELVEMAACLDPDDIVFRQSGNRRFLYAYAYFEAGANPLDIVEPIKVQLRWDALRASLWAADCLEAALDIYDARRGPVDYGVREAVAARRAWARSADPNGNIEIQRCLRALDLVPARAPAQDGRPGLATLLWAVGCDYAQGSVTRASVALVEAGIIDPPDWNALLLHWATVPTLDG